MARRNPGGWRTRWKSFWGPRDGEPPFRFYIWKIGPRAGEGYGEDYYQANQQRDGTWWLWFPDDTRVEGLVDMEDVDNTARVHMALGSFG